MINEKNLYESQLDLSDKNQLSRSKNTFEIVMDLNELNEFHVSHFHCYNYEKFLH